MKLALFYLLFITFILLFFHFSEISLNILSHNLCFSVNRYFLIAGAHSCFHFWQSIRSNNSFGT